MSIPRALLLGSGGRFPFNGHLRLRLRRGPTSLWLAARIGHGAPPAEAWSAVLVAHAAVERASGADRWQLCRDAWERLIDAPWGRPGPADLSALMIAEDPDGELISGVGLGGLWSLERAALRPMVPAKHPLLGEPGLPAQPPRVLAPQTPGPVYVARPWSDGGEPPPVRGVLEASGVLDTSGGLR